MMMMIIRPLWMRRGGASREIRRGGVCFRFRKRGERGAPAAPRPARGPRGGDEPDVCAHFRRVFDIDDFSTIMTTFYTLLLLFIISFISGRSTSGSSHGLIIALLSQPEMQAMVRSADGKAVSALATSTLLIPMEQIARLSMGTHSEAKVFVRVALAAREFLISMTRPSQNERRRQLKEQLETDAGMTDVVGKPGDPLPSLLSVIETSSANAEDRAVVLRAMEGYLRRVYFSYVLLLYFFSLKWYD